MNDDLPIPNLPLNPGASLSLDENSCACPFLSVVPESPTCQKFTPDEIICRSTAAATEVPFDVTESVAPVPKPSGETKL